MHIHVHQRQMSSTWTCGIGSACRIENKSQESLLMAFGSPIIRKKYRCFDRKLVEQITENPYHQYFIGLTVCQQKSPLALPLLVEFRKRLIDEIIVEISEVIVDLNHPDDDHNNDQVAQNLDNTDKEQKVLEAPKNKGVRMLGATYESQKIVFPQDINILNAASQYLEEMIDMIFYKYNEPKSRTYRQNARKDLPTFVKRTKRGGNLTRQAIRKQLQYV